MGPADRVVFSELAGGYTYYNRPGSSLDDHNREMAECVRLTRWRGHLDPYRPQGVGPGAATRGLVSGMIWSGPIAGFAAGQVENCMVVRGWRIVRLDEEAGQALAEAPSGALTDALASQVGSTAPTGAVVRTWANEGLRTGSYAIALHTRAPSNKQLSFRLFSAMSPGLPSEIAELGQPRLDPKWPKGVLKPSALSRAPAGSAIIVGRIDGSQIFFNRVGLDPDDHPSHRDHAPDYLFAVKTIWSGGGEMWFAFAVPPGRWRVHGSGYLTYCFGAPAFEVAADDVVYVGSFNLSGDITPDMNLEPAVAWLGETYRTRLRPAEYENGSRGDCHFIGQQYALEFPGRPFERGYTWGGAAQR